MRHSLLDTVRTLAMRAASRSDEHRPARIAVQLSPGQLPQRSQFLFAESRRRARLEVERPVQHRAGIFGQQFAELRPGRDARTLAVPAEPPRAGGDVRNLL